MRLHVQIIHVYLINYKGKEEKQLQLPLGPLKQNL